STEDEEIAEVAAHLGASVIQRPHELATDEVRLDGTLVHASETLQARGIDHRYVVTLQPTSPFRRGEDIDRAIRTVCSQGAGSLLSVRPVDCSPELMLRLEDRAKRFDPSLAKPFRRQDWLPVFQPNGAVYISHLELLQQGKLLEDEPAFVVMAQEHSVDLDTLFDFAVDEALISTRANASARANVFTNTNECSEGSAPSKVTELRQPLFRGGHPESEPMPKRRYRRLVQG
ncbi:MAG: hypothetical protein AAF550_11400, partial [Myxococcota bacterium]